MNTVPVADHGRSNVGTGYQGAGHGGITKPRGLLGARMNMNNSSGTSAAVKRRRRGVDWTVLVQLVAMVPSLLVGLGIVVLLIALVLGYVPNKPACTQWAECGALIIPECKRLCRPIVQSALDNWLLKSHHPGELSNLGDTGHPSST